MNRSDLEIPEPSRRPRYRRSMDVAYAALALGPWIGFGVFLLVMPWSPFTDPEARPPGPTPWMRAFFLIHYGAMLLGGILGVVHRRHRPLLVLGVGALLYLSGMIVPIFVTLSGIPAPRWLLLAILAVSPIALLAEILAVPVCAVLWLAIWRRRARAEDAFDPSADFL